MKAYFWISTSGPLSKSIKDFVQRIASTFNAEISEYRAGKIVTSIQGDVALHLNVIFPGGYSVCSVRVLCLMEWIHYESDWKGHARLIKDMLIEEIGDYVQKEIRKVLP